MKYLTDSEILKWSERLENAEQLLSYKLIPRYSQNRSHPDIAIRRVDAYGGHNIPISHIPGNYQSQPIETEFVTAEDNMINFHFSFSVISNRSDQFFDILNRLFNKEFGTKLYYNDRNGKESLYNVYLNKELLNKIKSEKHTLLEREFIKYTFDLKDKLTTIICFLSYVEDAIEFFQLIWGYEEDGKEQLLLDYGIGDIVSTVKNKSTDYLIVDYDYSKINGRYLINYILSEIIFDPKSPIIKYNTPVIHHKAEICPSRNNRIDNILGK